MKILIHTTSPNQCSAQLLQTVGLAVGEASLHVTDDRKAFADAIVNHRRHVPIVVIHLHARSHLEGIRPLKRILDGLFLILVIDSDDPQWIAACRDLYPRLLAHCPEDLELIGAVIQRRLALMSEQTPPPYTRYNASQRLV